MRRFSVAALAFVTCCSSASAKGVCSTGAYKTCVSCCKNSSGCYQPRAVHLSVRRLQILERQNKAGGNQ